MKTLQIGLECFPEQGGGLNRYYYDCTRYLPQPGVDVTDIVADSSTIEKDTNGRVKTFAVPDTSIPKRWLGVRNSF